MYKRNLKETEENNTANMFKITTRYSMRNVMPISQYSWLNGVASIEKHLHTNTYTHTAKLR